MGKWHIGKVWWKEEHHLPTRRSILGRRRPPLEGPEWFERVLSCSTSWVVSPLLVEGWLSSDVVGCYCWEAAKEEWYPNVLQHPWHAYKNQSGDGWVRTGGGSRDEWYQIPGTVLLAHMKYVAAPLLVGRRWSSHRCMLHCASTVPGIPGTPSDQMAPSIRCLCSIPIIG